MEKSGSQKVLKVLAIIEIIFAILGILTGIALAACAALPDAMKEVSVTFQDAGYNITASDANVIIIVMGIGLIIAAVVDLLIGIFALRGANDPSKIQVFWVLCVIGVVLSIVTILCAVFNGSTSGSKMFAYALELALNVWIFWLANNIKKQNA